jgi:hypothetical protein
MLNSDVQARLTAVQAFRAEVAQALADQAWRARRLAGRQRASAEARAATAEWRRRLGLDVASGR